MYQQRISKRQHHGQQVAVGHTRQIHKATVSYNTRIGAEHTEADATKQGEHQHGVEHLETVFYEQVGLAVQPERKYSRYEQNQCIQQKHTPIR